jgi:hypothetical protein
LGWRLLGERPGQHELGLEHVEVVAEAVEGSRREAMDRMLDPTPDVGNGAFCVALPRPVERLGGDAELGDKIVAEVLRLGLAALFLPLPDQRGFVRAHDDPRVRAAKEVAAIV